MSYVSEQPLRTISRASSPRLLLNKRGPQLSCRAAIPESSRPAHYLLPTAQVTLLRFDCHSTVTGQRVALDSVAASLSSRIRARRAWAAPGTYCSNPLRRA